MTPSAQYERDGCVAVIRLNNPPVNVVSLAEMRLMIWWPRSSETERI